MKEHPGWWWAVFTVDLCWFIHDTSLLRMDMPLLCIHHRSALKEETRLQHVRVCALWLHIPFVCIWHMQLHTTQPQSCQPNRTWPVCRSPCVPTPGISIWSCICLQPRPSCGGRTRLEHKLQGSELSPPWCPVTGPISHEPLGQSIFLF